MKMNKPAKSSNRLFVSYVLGMLAVVGFGATLPVTKIALEDFSPEFLTMARSLIAALLAIIVFFGTGKNLYHPKNFQIFIAGVLLIFGFPGFMALAMQTVPASHGGVILGFLPLSTAMIARILTEEKPTFAFWALSLLGSIVVASYIILKSDQSGQSGITIGDIYLIIAGLCASGGYVIFGKLSRQTSGWEITCRSLLLNLPLILTGFWLTWQPPFTTPSTEGIIALAYLGSVSMLLAFFAWNVALAWGGIARIGQLQLLQIFATLLVSALLLGETIDATTVITAMVITVIIAISRNY
jgi:drug/metabolite transporter (DMT)-like permease